MVLFLEKGNMGLHLGADLCAISSVFRGHFLCGIFAFQHYLLNSNVL